MYNLFFLIATACSANTTALPVQPALKDTPTIAPTVAVTHVETPLHQDLIPTLQDPSISQKPINPLVIKVCPTQQEVSLPELGLSPNDRLIVVSYDEPYIYSKGSLFTVKATDTTAQPINNTTPTKGELNRFSSVGVSPDGKWVLYERYHQPQDDELTLWISSTDGQQHWELATTPLASRAEWVSNQEIIVTDYYNREPIIRIFPFSYRLEKLSHIQGLGKSLAYLVRDSNLYDAYYGVDVDATTGKFVAWFALYDYAAQSKQKIFQWMPTEESPGAGPLSSNLIPWGWDIWSTRNGFTIVVQKTYGFDLVSDLDFAAAAQPKAYTEVMKSVILPDGDADWGVIESFPLLTDSFAFDRFYPKEPGSNKMKFHIFDYQHMVLKDYCLDRGNSAGGDFSPDERFFAWTVYEDQGNSKGKEVAVLNLETGQVARFPHVKLIGWGVVDQ